MSDREILKRGVEGVLEARTLFYNGRMDEIYQRLESFGSGDRFVFEVLDDRRKRYREPEVYEQKGVIVAKYFNPTRLREGIVLGVRGLDSRSVDNLKSAVPEGAFKEIVLVVYSKPSEKHLKEAERFLRTFKPEKLTVLHGGNYPMFNIMRHVLVPPHVILRPEEASIIFGRYEVPPDDPLRFPLIRENDPVARLIGAKRGDLVMIIRDSETAGRSLYYRYVIRYEDIALT